MGVLDPFVGPGIESTDIESRRMAEPQADDMLNVSLSKRSMVALEQEMLVPYTSSLSISASMYESLQREARLREEVPPGMQADKLVFAKTQGLTAAQAKPSVLKRVEKALVGVIEKADKLLYSAFKIFVRHKQERDK